jgi:hypothetical protein
MEISVELYGQKIGGDNLVETLMKKECNILLIVTGDDALTQTRLVLNATQAKLLSDKINNCFSAAAEVGFKIV